VIPFSQQPFDFRYGYQEALAIFGLPLLAAAVFFINLFLIVFLSLKKGVLASHA